MSNGRDASVAERLNEKLHRLCLLLFIVYLVLSSFCPVMNNVDLGWHVAQGRWMVQHAALYRHDVLNYPNLGHPVINEYPIFQVVLYLAWSLGWWGPSVLNALVYVLLLAVLIRAGRLLDLQTSAFLATALGLLLLYLQINSLLRPHLATYLGIVILATFLLRHRETTTWKVSWPMALLQVAWTNSHSGFVIGPAMAALFGAEMIVRHAIRDRAIPWPTLKTWLGAFLLILLACFVNPYGAGRFYPAFIQDHLESIRAYVGEMEPLGGTAEMLCEGLTLFAAFIVAGAVLRGRGAISYSFLLLAILFHSEAESIQKAWPVFGLFVPLLILSSGAFASDSGPARKTGMLAPYLILNFLITSILAMAVLMRLGGPSRASRQVQWRGCPPPPTPTSPRAAGP